MSRVRRTPEQKQALLAAWRASGVGSHRFARENGLSPKSLRDWGAKEAGAPAFLPVRVVDAAPRRAVPSLVVHIAGLGHRVEVSADFDPAFLRRLVEALC